MEKNNERERNILQVIWKTLLYFFTNLAHISHIGEVERIVKRKDIVEQLEKVCFLFSFITITVSEEFCSSMFQEDSTSFERDLTTSDVGSQFFFIYIHYPRLSETKLKFSSHNKT